LALRHLEPACAALCAERDDRSMVAAELRRVHEEGVAAMEDELGFVRAARHFHETVVAWCGNETMKAVVGALESLWSAKENAWARAATRSGQYPGPEMRESGLKAHARILSLIEKGDTDGVTRASYRHLCVTQRYALSEVPHELVEATVLRRSGP
jgi:GntR family transcriptional repressor for pyruvate dehydrogenase complex